MSDENAKKTSVKYALEQLIELIDLLIEGIEDREGINSPLVKKLKTLKDEV